MSSAASTPQEVSRSHSAASAQSLLSDYESRSWLACLLDFCSFKLATSNYFLIFLLAALVYAIQIFLCKAESLAKACQKSCRCMYDYGAKGPSTWRSVFKLQIGESQSPINICVKDCACLARSHFVWDGYSTTPSFINLHKDEETIILTGKWKCKPFIKYGEKCTKYFFHELRFRWGPSDCEGSEHTVNFKRYSMEIQATHIKDSYIGMACALKSKDKDALLIISYLLEADDCENFYLNAIVQHFWLLKDHPVNSNLLIKPFPLAWLMPQFTHGYFTYNGSLTYPPCSEVAKWIICAKTQAVGYAQSSAFRALLGKCESPILTNTRPVQYLRARKVHVVQ